MREPLFVKQNSAKWKSFEIEPSNDPDVLADRFIQITDDLAFAKTFYPDSKTTAYLNALAAGLHQSIYKNKTEKGNRFISFWKYELPLIFYTYRKELLYAFVFFFIFSLMGALSAKYDDSFVRIIMGDSYVDMTEASIAKNDPFAVYKQENEFLMWLTLGSNNVYVALKTFVCGIFASVGTIYMLFVNGIVLGSFQYFFFSKNLGMASVLVIWIHATIEISSIIIAGAAGLVLGNSILFPKTFSRIESLKRGAKDGMKIAIGIVPLFIVAAFLESFITRHTEMPMWLSVSILASSLIFIIWYVILYPKKLSKPKHTY
nr:stage II sporulation protein M [uncultured Mucilaginibacter sp.]